MKNSLYYLFIILLSFTLYAQAEEYYVNSNDGSDQTGDGSLSNPFKTIQKAADTMDAGDVCIIRSGVYREKVVPKDNQTFQAYEGEFALITGCDIITGWTLYENSIYKANVDLKVTQVFADTKLMYKARYPDFGGNRYLTRDFTATRVYRGTGNTGTITFTDGLNMEYIGGFITSINGDNAYQANMGNISEQSGNLLTITNTNHRWNHSNPGSFDGPGKGYIIDHLNALTVANEWHWQDGTLYFYPPDSQNPDQSEQVVEARVRFFGFDCSNKDNVQIKGLNFKAAAALLEESTNCVIDDCTFRYVSTWGRKFYTYDGTDMTHYNYGDKDDGSSGIHINGSNNIIKNCYVAYGWGALISLRGQDNIVQNNYLEECNWQLRQDAVAVMVNGSNQKVFNNTIRKSNSMAISMRDVNRVLMIAPQIKYNDIRQYGYTMKDGGTAGIYYNANSEMQGGEFAYNFIAENKTSNQRVSTGIYLDDGAYNATVHHNVVHGANINRSGFFTHKGGQDLYVYHNTFWKCTQAGWISAVWSGNNRDQATMIYRNNHTSGAGFAKSGVNDPITQDHNRANVDDSELVNVNGFDFQIANSNSASIDAGALISGINDGYLGDAPDLGAFEFGATAWTAGSTVVPPTEWPDEDLILGLSTKNNRILPQEFELHQNFPNPFNPKTKIGFKLAANSNVRIEIFNAAGQNIRLLLNEQKNTGSHFVVWDGLDRNNKPVNSGIYFYRLTAISANNYFNDSKKMVLIK